MWLKSRVISLCLENTGPGPVRLSRTKISINTMKDSNIVHDQKVNEVFTECGPITIKGTHK